MPTQPVKPIILKEGSFSPADLASLNQTQKIWQTNDVYQAQLAEYFEITHPDLLFSSDFKQQQAAWVKERAGGEPQSKGNWIYFPWSGFLVHTVNEEQYNSLRTNRNRNLITSEEQEKLRNICTGVAGLSVGSNIAFGLQYQGIANALKLAEFDTLETTNLNRVRAGLPDIGQKKADIFARDIYELNPYADLVFYEKLTDENMESFFNQDPRPRVVFDEIDDFKMKIKLRLKARAAGIPLIMLTNLGDSTMIDVERYDQDPKLPLFNSLLGDLPEEILDNPQITPDDVKKYAIQIVGRENVPPRAMDSVKEIGHTLVGRPQLSNTVTICGGIGTYLVRQLVIHDSLKSGRKVVRYEEFL